MEECIVVNNLEEVAGVMTLLRESLTTLGVPKETIFDIQLCLSEAVNNGIVHGNQQAQEKSVRVSWVYESGVFCFKVEDEGNGWQADLGAETICIDEGLLEENGRGLFLMDHLLDKLWFNEKGNQVWGEISWGNKGETI